MKHTFRLLTAANWKRRPSVYVRGPVRDLIRGVNIDGHRRPCNQRSKHKATVGGTGEAGWEGKTRTMSWLTGT